MGNKDPIHNSKKKKFQNYVNYLRIYQKKNKQEEIHKQKFSNFKKK